MFQPPKKVSRLVADRWFGVAAVIGVVNADANIPRLGPAGVDELDAGSVLLRRQRVAEHDEIEVLR